MIPAEEALARLRQGNDRFAKGIPKPRPSLNSRQRQELAAGQEPFAIVLGCSDSRVPAELVFDQGFGDLFVIRVAGNIVAPSQIGSVEFSASVHKARLVVVLGHTQCGAIHATIQDHLGFAETDSENLASIVERVRPAVVTMLEAGLGDDMSVLEDKVTRTNVRIAVDHLRHGSPLLEKLIAEAGLLVVGAVYNIETGIVEFLS